MLFQRGQTENNFCTLTTQNIWIVKEHFNRMSNITLDVGLKNHQTISGPSRKDFERVMMKILKRTKE